jgi:hypothetical protein
MLFLQGQFCFFCDRPIPKAEASVEHLIPSSGGGSDHPDNLVACCKTLNSLFGNMSVKEKLRAILKQNGKFVCPNHPADPAVRVNEAPSPTQDVATGATGTASGGNAQVNHGRPWTAAEDKRLADAFDAHVSLQELAKTHQRGIGGVQSRLTKLGKLVPPQPKRFIVS